MAPLGSLQPVWRLPLPSPTFFLGCHQLLLALMTLVNQPSKLINHLFDKLQRLELKPQARAAAACHKQAPSSLVDQALMQASSQFLTGDSARLHHIF